MRFTTLLTALSCTALVSADSSRSNRAKRDASTVMAYESGATAKNTDGEDHGTPPVPSGAQLTSLAVGTDGDQVAVYWQESPKNDQAKQAFVMIHGRQKDGNAYWTTMNDILESAVKNNYPNADSNAIVVAPEFYSAKLNSGQYADDVLTWDDVNAWQAGEVAIHPQGAKESSFDVLDALVDEFANKNKYPAMQTLIFVGHGGGGQLLNRYAIVGKDAPSGINMRWIVGDPSSAPYFTKDRPQIDASVATIEDCPTYNTWRYGFDNFTGTLELGLKTPQEYFAQIIKRDVRYVIGYDDTDESGDQYCMALLQGGVARRDRNLIWWKYINSLAKTAEDVSGFPGTFSSLPDWSSSSLNIINHRLTVVEGAEHNAEQVFGSDEGRAVLFEDDNTKLPTGWRPSGWNPSGNGQRITAYHQSNTTTTTKPAVAEQALSSASTLLTPSALFATFTFLTAFFLSNLIA